MSATTTIEHVVEIDATPDTVFDLWVTAEGLCAWWAESASCDPRPGGAIRVNIDGEHIMVGEIIELDRPNHLRFTFGWENSAPAAGSTEVDVRIESTGHGSRLTLRHHGLPIEFVASHAEGWLHFLGDRLASTQEIQ